MSDMVIRVEGLGKCYRIGAAQKKTVTLGQQIKNLVASPLDYLGSTLRPPSEEETLWALKDVSFEVERGEVIGIIGRNGSGKSTLLKILSRITEPTTGRAEVYGRIASLLEVGTGFHPELTGRENIYMNGAILGMRKAEIDNKFDEIMGFAEVDKFIDTPVKRYSSGMYVRLAFAVAAHLEPEILLVDEVLAVGDMEFQNKCLNKMQDISKGGRTVLFVSHNMGAVNRLCSRCILLDRGRILLSGPTDEVIKKYISMGALGRSEYLQPNSPSKPMNLRRISLTTDEGLTLQPEFRYDQEFKIIMEYEVNQPVHGCTVWISLETLDGIMVFTTADFDNDPALLGYREAGYYISSVAIPPKWLNYGSYIVIAGLVQNSPVIVYDRVEALFFTILEVGSPSSMHEAGTRRGVLQPLLKWRTNRLSDSPGSAEAHADV